MSEVEEIARKQGWQDKDTWVANGGDPALHRTADEFIAVGEQIERHWNTKARKYEDMVGDLQTRNLTLEKRVEALQGGYVKMSQKAYERGKRDIKAQIKAATEEGDTEAVERLLGEMDELDKNREETAKLEAETEAQEDRPDAMPQEVQEWLVKNPWMRNPESEADMMKIVKVEWAAKRFERTNPNATGAEVVEHLEQALEDYEKGQINMTKETTAQKETEIPSQPRTPRQLAGGDHYGDKGGGNRSWGNLPPEARETCEDLQDQGYLPEGEEGRKRYLESYIWDDHQGGVRGIHA